MMTTTHNGGALMPLSQKYIDFINATNVRAEYLEGTTSSGKTTIGAGVKFMRMVSKSDKKHHVIASKTVGKAEMTILNQANGVLDLHKNAEYFGNGTKNEKIPHVKFENKIIFILSYGDRSKWEYVLGAQFGAVYVDEINTANIEFLREIITRCDYFLATCNPDDPRLPVYKEFINRSRPFKKYTADVPPSILEELQEPPVKGWKYWFFTFGDNLSMTPEAIALKKAASPPGTKSHKNKILGLRGRAEGLVFGLFDPKRHCVSAKEVKEKQKKKELKFFRFSVGLDTSYSRKSKDTISAAFIGITTRGEVYVLDTLSHNNAIDGDVLGPSDVVQKYEEFIKKNEDEWGGFCRAPFYDSADSGFAAEFLKHKRKNGSVYSMTPSWKVPIRERIDLQSEWMAQGYFYILDHCADYIDELNAYSWDERQPSAPEDGNDHVINACQYAFTPFIPEIGANFIQK